MTINMGITGQASLGPDIKNQMASLRFFDLDKNSATFAGMCRMHKERDSQK